MQSLRLGVKTGRGPYRRWKISKGWETKTMIRLFRFKRHKEETSVDFHTRTCNMARKIWIQMGLSLSVSKKCREYVASHGMGS